MSKIHGGRPGFREWIDKQPAPEWPLMPLTHITKGLTAEDVIRAGKVDTHECSVLGQSVAYFFYGRPAYRLTDDGAVKVEAACPFCFIFDPNIIHQAEKIHAFDTGAFAKRLYKHILQEEMDIADFSLEKSLDRPNKLISRVFGSMQTYFDGDTSKIVSVEEGAEPYEFHARAYLQLLASPGRNEPDDRICTIEIAFSNPVSLGGQLKAVIVPITLWNDRTKTPWLHELHSSGVAIRPYLFVPGRHPEHYHALLEASVRDYYAELGVMS